jgi:hypothetical protein
MSKYRNIKTEIDGIQFDSQREAKRYCELRLLVRIGEIDDLKLQVPFELAPSVILDGRKKPPLRYNADFVYMKNGKQVIEDAKGRPTKEYRIKRHLMKVQGLDIVEV